MNAVFGAVSLAADGIEAVSGLRVNGQQVNQEAQLLRTQAPLLFARGNRSLVIEFTVSRVFDTLALAEAFVHDHFATLPQQADLVFTLSGGGTKTYASAVLDACSPSQFGLSVQITYAFRAIPITS